MKKISSLLTLLVLVFGMTKAQIITVPTDQPNIQAGIDIANNGDTVIVNPGTYIENINFNGKNIVVGSQFVLTGDTSYISQTIIDGNQSGAVVTFNNYENSNAVLSGFTITNGSGNLFVGSSYYGGGISCDSASPGLQYLHITGNTVNGYGGGIHAYNSDVVVEYVVVDNNSAGLAGGIYFNNSYNTNLTTRPKPTLRNSVIKYNTAGVRAGGVYCSYTIATLSNVELSYNSADYGGAMFLGSARVGLSNITLSHNTANTQAGIIYMDASQATIVNSILWDNSPQAIYLYPDPGYSTVTVDYSDVQGDSSIINDIAGVMNWGTHNMNVLPSFIDSTNFHLQGNSPCIDSGSSFFVWQNDTIVNMSPADYLGMAPEMGAYEYAPASGILPAYSSKELSLLAYPNPANENIQISYCLSTFSDVELRLYDITGTCLKTEIFSDQKEGEHLLQWHLNDLPAGNYFIQIRTKDGKSSALKLLKK